MFAPSVNHTGGVFCVGAWGSRFVFIGVDVSLWWSCISIGVYAVYGMLFLEKMLFSCHVLLTPNCTFENASSVS